MKNEEAVVEVISSLLSVAMIVSVSIATISWGGPYIEEFQNNSSIQSVQHQFNVLSQSLASMANDDLLSLGRSYDLSFSKGEVTVDSYADRMILSYILNEENHMNYNFTISGLESPTTDFSIILHEQPHDGEIVKIEAFYFESSQNNDNSADHTIINLDESNLPSIISTEYITFTWPDLPGVANRYRLENYLNIWSSWSKDTSKTYSNLPDGEYIFKVNPEAGSSYEYSFQKLQGFITNQTLLPTSPGGHTYSFTTEEIIEGTVRFDVYNSNGIFARIFVFDLGYIAHTFSSSFGEYKTILQNNGLLSILSSETTLKRSPDFSFSTLPGKTSAPSTAPTGSDWWPMIHCDASNQGASSMAKAPETDNLLWTFETGDNRIVNSPAVVNGKAYIATEKSFSKGGGSLYCVNVNDGSQLWTFDIDEPDMFWTPSPAVVNEKLYICSVSGNFYCLDANNGNKIWERNIAAPTIWSSPTIKEDKIFIGSYVDRKMHCLNATDGSELWNFSSASRIQSTPSVSDNNVFFGTEGGIIYCLDATTGLQLWNFSRGVNELASLSVVNGRVYLGANGDGVYCLDAETGLIIWKYDINAGGSYSSVAVYNEKVYTSSGTVVLCLDALTGEQIWRRQHPDDFNIGETGWFLMTTPAATAGNVFFWTVGSRGHIFCFDAEDGEIKWTYPVRRNSGPHPGPALADGKLFAGSIDGNLYCFGDEIDDDIDDDTPGLDDDEFLQKMISFRVTQFRTNERVFSLGGKHINVNVGFSLQIDNSREVLTEASSIQIQLYGPHHGVWMNFFTTYGFDQIGENMLVFDKGKLSLLSLTQTQYHVSVG